MKSTIVTGRVAAFDVPVGLGRIEGDDGLGYDFHCVEIADGSRDVAVGAEVAFRVLAKLGEHEAVAITPVAGPTETASAAAGRTDDPAVG